MTLLQAVESLALTEVIAVSWINVIPIHTGDYLAVFTIAFLLPFFDASLPDEFRAGQPRFWPNQRRLLDDDIAIQEQIRELHNTQMLGNLEHVYLIPTEG